MTASVIIPAHNAQETIGRQLEALSRQLDAPDFEVIVVANNCTDRTSDVAKAFTDRLRLTVIEANERSSAAYARNVGADHASGTYLLFCDADDEVTPTWVVHMVEPLQAGLADFVGGYVEVDRRNMPNWLFEWRYRPVFVEGQKPSGKGPMIITAAFGIKRDVFLAIGGFDTKYSGVGYEDLEINDRLWKAGYRAGRAERAVVLYGARTTYKAVLAQQMGYESGRRDYHQQVGMGLHPTTLRKSIWASLQQIRRYIRRTHSLHPKAAVCIFHFHFSRMMTRKRLERALRKKGVPVTPTPPPLGAMTGCARLDSPLIGGLGFATTSRSHARLLYTNDIMEPGTLALIRDLLPAGGTFVDVGANIGTMTVAAALSCGSTGKVIAFEPNPEARQLLEINTHRHRVNDRIEIRSEAVGAQASSVDMHFYENSLVSGAAKALEIFVPGRSIQRVVDVVALDEVIDRPVSMLKIDVEGFELEVLHGARRILEDNRDIAVIFEVNIPILHHLHRSSADIFALFPPSEWSTYLVDDSNNRPILEHIDHQLDAHTIRSKRHYANVLAVRTGVRRIPEHLLASEHFDVT